MSGSHVSIAPGSSVSNAVQEVKYVGAGAVESAVGCGGAAVYPEFPQGVCAWVDTDAAAKVLLAYYAAWNPRTESAVVEDKGTGVASEVESVRTFASSAVSTTSKAVQRRNKRVQAQVAKEKLDFPMSVQFASPANDGFCYLGVMSAHLHGLIADRLGPFPTFSDLIAAPVEWYLPLTVLLGISVTRVSSDLFHLGESGPSFATTVSMLTAGSSAEGLTALVRGVSYSDSIIGKVRVTDRLGSNVHTEYAATELAARLGIAKHWDGPMIKHETVTQLDAQSAPNDCLVLCMSMSDKLRLIHEYAGFSHVDIKTIFELQLEGRYAHIRLYRFSDSPERFYDDEAHVAVALSRYTQSFVYVRPDNSYDLVGRWLERLKLWSDQLASKHQASMEKRAQAHEEIKAPIVNDEDGDTLGVCSHSVRVIPAALGSECTAFITNSVQKSECVVMAPRNSRDAVEKGAATGALAGAVWDMLTARMIESAMWKPGDPSSFECAVCYHSVVGCGLTVCGHGVCPDCLSQWATVAPLSKGGPTCPVCRGRLSGAKKKTLGSRLVSGEFPSMQQMYDMLISTYGQFGTSREAAGVSYCPYDHTISIPGLQLQLTFWAGDDAVNFLRSSALAAYLEVESELINRVALMTERVQSSISHNAYTQTQMALHDTSTSHGIGVAIDDIDGG